MCLTAMGQAAPEQRVVMQIPGDAKAPYLSSLVNTAQIAGARGQASIACLTRRRRPGGFNG
jgi:hypothetical protein